MSQHFPHYLTPGFYYEDRLELVLQALVRKSHDETWVSYQGSCYVTQAGLKLLAPSDPPASASQGSAR